MAEAKDDIGTAIANSEPGVIPPKTLKQSEAELRDNISDALMAQDAEVVRVRALLDQVHERMADYAGWQAKLTELVENARAKEKDLLVALDAALYARALLESRKAGR